MALAQVWTGTSTTFISELVNDREAITSVEIGQASQKWYYNNWLSFQIKRHLLYIIHQNTF